MLTPPYSIGDVYDADFSFDDHHHQIKGVIAIDHQTLAVPKKNTTPQYFVMVAGDFTGHFSEQQKKTLHVLGLDPNDYTAYFGESVALEQTASLPLSKTDCSWDQLEIGDWFIARYNFVHLSLTGKQMLACKLSDTRSHILAIDGHASPFDAEFNADVLKVSATLDVPATRHTLAGTMEFSVVAKLDYSSKAKQEPETPIERPEIDRGKVLWEVYDMLKDLQVYSDSLTIRNRASELLAKVGSLILNKQSKQASKAPIECPETIEERALLEARQILKDFLSRNANYWTSRAARRDLKRVASLFDVPIIVASQSKQEPTITEKIDINDIYDQMKRETQMDAISTLNSPLKVPLCIYFDAMASDQTVGWIKSNDQQEGDDMPKKTKKIALDSLKRGERIKVYLQDDLCEWYVATGTVIHEDDYDFPPFICLDEEPRFGTWQYMGTQTFIDWCENELPFDPAEEAKKFGLRLTQGNVWLCLDSDTTVLERLGMEKEVDEEDEDEEYEDEEDEEDETDDKIPLEDIKVGDEVILKLRDDYPDTVLVQAVCVKQDEGHPSFYIFNDDDLDENWHTAGLAEINEGLWDEELANAHHFGLTPTPNQLWSAGNNDTTVMARIGTRDKAIKSANLKIGDVVRIKMRSYLNDDDLNDLENVNLSWMERELVLISPDTEEDNPIMLCLDDYCLEDYDTFELEEPPSSAKANAKKLGLSLTTKNCCIYHPSCSQIIERIGTYDKKKGVVPLKRSKKTKKEVKSKEAASTKSEETVSNSKTNSESDGVGAGLLIGGAIAAAIGAIASGNKVQQSVRVDTALTAATETAEALTETAEALKEAST
jgi:hypothetical protein